MQMYLIRSVSVILLCSHISFGFKLSDNVNDNSIIQFVGYIERIMGFLDNSTIARFENVMDEYLNLENILSPANKESTRNITELIKSNGFDVEEHEVITEDGYILRMFRIPGNGPTIFLMHGILLSADDWVTAGRETGLAYLLAERGFDVWMGNARGTKHSRRHKTLSPDTDEAQFFDFSFYEIGIYDLPAMIDYVLHQKNLSRLIYLGHSQGTTSFFVMCSEKLEYNSKISLMIALSPLGAIPHVRTPLFLILKLVTFYQSKWLYRALRLSGYNEFLPNSPLTRFITVAICGDRILQTICNSVVDLVAGFDYSQANYTTLPTVYAHLPAGLSTKQLEHYAQTIASGKFSKFDYGIRENLERYGSRTPPEIPTKNITTPVALLYGKNDQLATPTDLFKLRENLLSVITTYEIPYAKFNHLDFVYAKDFKLLVLPKILELLRDSLANKN